ncbi:MAG TPA: peptide-methionine (S)-S-oxide reductase MsrA [Phycisphaerales bacterium]|nr:peptide-methionine (S)-S-oxide reductase MsrA [Phycisphaerales bacterium]
MPNQEKLKKATFAGGCFWCTEAIFQEMKGVYKVTSGYIGGQVENPTYKAVCTGQTGHAEAVEITYNPEEVTFQELLEVHFKTHDPTTLNRQGADRGTQYRSGIFYHDEEQKKAAEDVIRSLEQEKVYPDPIVTEVTEATIFYPAEDYHQDYYANNGQAGYCQMVITPKMEKFRKVFAEKIRQEKAGK